MKATPLHKVLLVLTSSALLSPAAAAISFNFNYEDVNNSTGVGFDDANQGQARRDTVAAVGSYLNSVLDHTASVDITWNESPTQFNGVIASMFTEFTPNRGIHLGTMGEHIQSGLDPDTNTADATGQINFGFDWNTNHTTQGSTSGGQLDLFSIALHEITHALGFSSLILEDGSSRVEGTYSLFDTHLYNRNGTPLIDENGNYAVDPRATTSGRLTFNDGQYAIYSPSQYDDGSSISHYDDQQVNTIMGPTLFPGTELREYTQADLDALQLLGYQLQGVPEPSTLPLITLAALPLLRRQR